MCRHLGALPSGMGRPAGRTPQRCMRCQQTGPRGGLSMRQARGEAVMRWNSRGLGRGRAVSRTKQTALVLAEMVSQLPCSSLVDW